MICKIIQCLGKELSDSPSARLITLTSTLIISHITKTSSNKCLICYSLLIKLCETPRKFIIAIINLRGVSTKLNKYIVFTMQTYKKLIML